MKNLMVLALLFYSYSASSQKILYDKKDPFTGVRTLVTSSLKLNKAFEVSGSLAISDSGVVYLLSFTIPSLPITTVSADTIKDQCEIMSGDGKVFTGKWISTSSVPIGVKVYNMHVYSFRKEDGEAMGSGEVSALKFRAGMVEVPEKNKIVISRIITTLQKKQRYE